MVEIGHRIVEAHTLAGCRHFVTEERPAYVIGHILNLSARVATASGPDSRTLNRTTYFLTEISFPATNPLRRCAKAHVS